MEHRHGMRIRITTADQRELPHVVHNGTPYIVAQPGHVFHVRVERDASDDYSDVIRVELYVDERYAGYSKLLYRGHPAGTFKGFLISGGPKAGQGTDGHACTMATYQEFKFSSYAAPEGPGARSAERPEDIPAGRLKLRFWQTMKAGATSVPKGGVVRDAEAARLPDKKFFMSPSLKTDCGRTQKLASTWSRFEWAKVGEPVWEQEVRYETVDTLVLRRILSCDNPDHYQLLAGCTIPSVQEALGLGTQSQEDVKPQGTPLGLVKVKRDEAASWQPSPADNMMIDMTQHASQEVPPFVLPDGRMAGHDEVVMCDLADSDDDAQPVWDLVKKEYESFVV